MEIIPVIDLRSGCCSRVLETNPLLKSVYRKDPLEQALVFQERGVKTLHVVDMDGVFAGYPCALEIVRDIIDHTGLAVQISGGYRSMDSIGQAVASGVKRVVLTTAAIRSPQLVTEAVHCFAHQVVVGIDGIDGKATIEGWEYGVDKSVFELAEEIRGWGVRQIVYNDVRRNGSLSGPDFASIERLLKSGLAVIPSGGVNGLESLEQLQTLGVKEVLVGKAVYNGAIDLAPAINKLA